MARLRSPFDTQGRGGIPNEPRDHRTARLSDEELRFYTDEKVDHYRRLGITRDTLPHLRKVFLGVAHRLVPEHYPLDKWGDINKALRLAIEAFQTLKDEKTRGVYDKTLDAVVADGVKPKAEKPFVPTTYFGMALYTYIHDLYDLRRPMAQKTLLLVDAAVNNDPERITLDPKTLSGADFNNILRGFDSFVSVGMDNVITALARRYKGDEWSTRDMSSLILEETISNIDTKISSLVADAAKKVDRDEREYFMSEYGAAKDGLITLLRKRRIGSLISHTRLGTQMGWDFDGALNSQLDDACTSTDLSCFHRTLRLIAASIDSNPKILGEDGPLSDNKIQETFSRLDEFKGANLASLFEGADEKVSSNYVLIRYHLKDLIKRRQPDVAGKLEQVFHGPERREERGARIPLDGRFIGDLMIGVIDDPNRAWLVSVSANGMSARLRECDVRDGELQIPDLPRDETRPIVGDFLHPPAFEVMQKWGRNKLFTLTVERRRDDAYPRFYVNADSPIRVRWFEPPE